MRYAAADVAIFLSNRPRKRRTRYIPHSPVRNRRETNYPRYRWRLTSLFQHTESLFVKKEKTPARDRCCLAAKCSRKIFAQLRDEFLRVEQFGIIMRAVPTFNGSRVNS